MQESVLEPSTAKAEGLEREEGMSFCRVSQDDHGTWAVNPISVATFSWTTLERDRTIGRHGTQEAAARAGAREAVAHPPERGGAAAGGWSRRSRGAPEHVSMGAHGAAEAG